MISKTVNRIYQGRVVKVQLKNNTDWEEYKAWESLLLNHHKIFQDAVNYYLLCFVALAGNENRPSDDKPCPVYRLREQIKEKWKDFTYKGIQRKGMQKSVVKYLFPKNSSQKFEDFLDKVLEGNNACKESLHKALTALLKHCSGGNSIQQGGREFAPAFFDKKYTGLGAFKEGKTAKEKKIAFEKFKRDLWDDDLSPQKLSDKSDPNDVLNLTNKQPYKNKELKEKLMKALDEFKSSLNSEITPKEIKKLENIIDKKIKEGLNIPSYGGGGGNIGLRSKVFILFKYVKSNETTRKFLRKIIPKGTTSISAAQSQNLQLAVQEEDPIKYCRGERGYVFPAFTALSEWGGSDLGEPQWKEFDIAAFKEALTVIHQIDDKTKEREKEKQKIQKKLEWMEKHQWTEKKKG